jgi:uncharacterized membrane protein YfcA
MTAFEVIALIISGLFVGFINTLAGGATIISLSIFMMFGLPANVANGTNRIAAFLQTLVAVGSFKKQKILEEKKGIKLGIPAAIGSIIGAKIAIDLDEKIIEKAVAVIMLIMLVFILYKPKRWLKQNDELVAKKVSIFQIILFFFIGVYGGFIHAGVGYLLIAGVVVSAGYDLVKANAIKNLIVLMYVPFTLLIFIISNQVNYKYGLIHAIGNIIGAYFASKFAVSWGPNFVKWLMVVVILFLSAQMFGIIDMKSIIKLWTK